MKLSKKKKSDRLRIWMESGIFDFICSNCGEKTRDGHYAPPFMNEEGFWTCGT